MVEIEQMEEQQLVQADTTGLHEQKIYNQIRDALWTYVDVSQQDETTLARNIKQIRTLLLRADSLWGEIDQAFQVRYQKMHITPTKIYDGELKARINELDKLNLYMRYIDSIQLPSSMLEDWDFKIFQQLRKPEKIEFIQKEISSIVRNADQDWGSNAVKAGLNLPISVREGKNLFFRGYRKAASAYKRW
jgi:hypothetical protein